MELIHAIRAARNAVGIARRVDPAENLRRHFEQASVDAFREMSAISFAVSRAIVALQLGADFQDSDVDTFLEGFANDPAFASRVYRLLSEGLKTTSKRRRRFLAAVLYGLPFSKLPSDDRERVDMVTERMTPDDASVLKTIATFAHPGLPAYVVFDRSRIELLTSKQVFEQNVSGPGLPLNAVAFSSLQSLGCIEVRSETFSEGDDRVGFTVHVTAVGTLILSALQDECVQAGLNVRLDDEHG